MNNNCIAPLIVNQAIPLLDPYDPAKVLVIRKNKKITQQDFLQDLTQLVTQLPDHGFALNLCEDRYYFMLGFCALLVKGCINLLPPNRQALTLTEIAQDFPNCYCLFDSQQECSLPSIRIDALLAKKEALKNISILPHIPAQQIAAIAFTSGSTGKPKPNHKPWGTLATTARLLGERLFTDVPNPIIVATVPSQHMYGLESTVMMALQAGSIMHSEKPFFPADVCQVISNHNQPCMLVTAPVHLRAIVNAGLMMPPLAGIISATAPLDMALAQQAEECFSSRLWEIYGCTEAGSMATRRSTQNNTWQLLSGFKLTTDNNLFFASADHLAETAPIQDLLELVSPTEFLLCGRSTDMINVAGKRASLANLTLQLLAIPGVEDGVFFLPPMLTKNNNDSAAHSKEQRPAALVVSNLSEKSILAALALRLDPTFLPRPLRKVKRLPRNETGKLTMSSLNLLWGKMNEPD